jgi:hypothetical protein
MKCETCNKISALRVAKDPWSYDAFDEAVEQLKLLDATGRIAQLNPEILPRYFECNNCGGTWEIRFPDPPIPGGLLYESPRSKRIRKIKTKYER